MNDRIHGALDGGLPRAALSPAEEAELREMEDAIAAASALVRSRPAPDLTARVMAALPDVRESASLGARFADGIARAFDWVWTPRPFTLRPAFGMAGAFAVAGFLLFGGPVPVEDPASVPGPAPVAAAPGETPEQPIYVQFRLDAANASNVALAGSFTEWQPSYPLHEAAPGVWTVLVPLDPGVHDYLFVVDGERWVPDPVAQPVADGFGGTNSRLLLASPTREA